MAAFVPTRKSTRMLQMPHLYSNRTFAQEHDSTYSTSK